MRPEPYYIEVHKDGRHDVMSYQEGDSSDWAAKTGHKKRFLAYRIKVTPKTHRIITSPGVIDTEKARQAINGATRYVWAEPALPPAYEPMLKAFGAFGVLMLCCIFATWMITEIFFK